MTALELIGAKKKPFCSMKGHPQEVVGFLHRSEACPPVLVAALVALSHLRAVFPERSFIFPPISWILLCFLLATATITSYSAEIKESLSCRCFCKT